MGDKLYINLLNPHLIQWVISERVVNGLKFEAVQEDEDECSVSHFVAQTKPKASGHQGQFGSIVGLLAGDLGKHCQAIEWGTSADKVYAC